MIFRVNFTPLFCAFWCFALFGIAAPLPAAEPKATAPASAIELRIFSYNILGGDGTGGTAGGRAGTGNNAWSARRDLVATLLRDQKPDVIGLQKAGRVSLDDLRKALPGLGEVGVGRDDGKVAGEYAAILYRTDRFDLSESGTFWLSETPETAGTAGWGMRQARVCTWARFIEKNSGSAFYYFNTHLDPGAATARDNSATLILARIAARAHRDPFILGGDMNSGEASSTIRLYKAAAPSAALLDTFRVLHPDETGVGTRHQFTGQSQGEKVDYILVPAAVAVLESAILRDKINDRFPSDHFPVAATVRLGSAYP
jgi:endonuclease/exonuclease/phosphatase family metal-dependent hydrolase